MRTCLVERMATLPLKPALSVPTTSQVPCMFLATAFGSGPLGGLGLGAGANPVKLTRARRATKRRTDMAHLGCEKTGSLPGRSSLIQLQSIVPDRSDQRKVFTGADIVGGSGDRLPLFPPARPPRGGSPPPRPAVRQVQHS